MTQASMGRLDILSLAEDEPLAFASMVYVYAHFAGIGAEHADGNASGPIRASLLANGLSTQDAEIVDRRVHSAAAYLSDETKDVAVFRFGDYYETRDAVMSEFGIESQQGAPLWPVTGVTIKRVFGGQPPRWSEAVATFGLAAGRRGRRSGQVLWSDSDLEDAWATYLGDPARASDPPAIASYEQWRNEREEPTPSISSLIQRLANGRWTNMPQLRATAGESASGTAPIPNERPAPQELRRQQVVVEVQQDFVAALEIQHLDLQNRAREGDSSAAQQLAWSTQLLTWARLGVTAAETTLAVEKAQADREKVQAAEAKKESDTRWRTDVVLAAAVILSSVGAAVLGPYVTMWIS